jgi:hypothetical protein
LGAINFKGTFSKPLKMDDFVFTAPGLSTKGRINFRHKDANSPRPPRSGQPRR